MAEDRHLESKMSDYATTEYIYQPGQGSFAHEVIRDQLSLMKTAGLLDSSLEDIGSINPSTVALGW